MLRHCFASMESDIFNVSLRSLRSFAVNHGLFRYRPYRDATIGIHLAELQVVRGQFDIEQIPEVLVYVWVMRNNKLTSAASYKVGQSVELELKPWDVVKAKVGGYNRLGIDDPMVLMLNAYWGEE